MSEEKENALTAACLCLIVGALLLYAAVAGAQPAFNLNGEPLTALRCDGGVVCARRGTVAYVYGSGSAPSSGGGAPVDAGFVVWSAAATTGSTNERVLTAGTNVTLDVATPGQVIINASGGGGSSTYDGGYLLVQDEGADLTKRSTIDFVGAGVTCTDSGGKTSCSVPGGSGSGTSPYVLSFGGF